MPLVYCRGTGCGEKWPRPEGQVRWTRAHGQGRDFGRTRWLPVHRRSVCIGRWGGDGFLEAVRTLLTEVEQSHKSLVVLAGYEDHD